MLMVIHLSAFMKVHWMHLSQSKVANYVELLEELLKAWHMIMRHETKIFSFFFSVIGFQKNAGGEIMQMGVRTATHFY
jgi:hypothetical protein